MRGLSPESKAHCQEAADAFVAGDVERGGDILAQMPVEFVEVVSEGTWRQEEPLERSEADMRADIVQHEFLKRCSVELEETGRYFGAELDCVEAFEWVQERVGRDRMIWIIKHDELHTSIVFHSIRILRWTHEVLQFDWRRMQQMTGATTGNPLCGIACCNVSEHTLECFDQLVEACGISIHSQDGDDHPPMAIAAQSDNVELADHILKRQYDNDAQRMLSEPVDQRGTARSTLGQYIAANAFFQKSPGIIRWLMDIGTNFHISVEPEDWRGQYQEGVNYDEEPQIDTVSDALQEFWRSLFGTGRESAEPIRCLADTMPPTFLERMRREQVEAIDYMFSHLLDFDNEQTVIDQRPPKFTLEVLQIFREIGCDLRYRNGAAIIAAVYWKSEEFAWLLDNDLGEFDDRVKAVACATRFKGRYSGPDRWNAEMSRRGYAVFDGNNATPLDVLSALFP